MSKKRSESTCYTTLANLLANIRYRFTLFSSITSLIKCQNYFKVFPFPPSIFRRCVTFIYETWKDEKVFLFWPSRFVLLMNKMPYAWMEFLSFPRRLLRNFSRETINHKSTFHTFRSFEGHKIERNYYSFVN
jgi:hypothetical protein